MTTNHTPGPWTPVKSGQRSGTYWVGRLLSPQQVEFIRSPSGRPTSFRTDTAARAAAVKAQGGTL